jgi:hypothetical protein
MTVTFAHSRATELPIKIPAIGLDLYVRLPPIMNDGVFCFMETVNAPGKGPPQHRHREAEIFRIIQKARGSPVDPR